MLKLRCARQNLAFFIMPVIKSAIKKLRKDTKRTSENDKFRRELELALRDAKKTKSSKSASHATSLVDKAVKKNLMHKNKAARVKSSLSKLAKPAAKTESKTTKPTSKKSATKARSTK